MTISAAMAGTPWTASDMARPLGLDREHAEQFIVPLAAVRYVKPARSADLWVGILDGPMVVAGHGESLLDTRSAAGQSVPATGALRLEERREDALRSSTWSSSNSDKTPD
jgi:hypothetical protein